MWSEPDLMDQLAVVMESMPASGGGTSSPTAALRAISDAVADHLGTQ